MQPEEIAARVWPGREVELEPLGGGITNRNFKVTVGGRDRSYSGSAGRTRPCSASTAQAEHEATSIAADLEIGPEVVAFVEPEGYLVTRFVEGSPLPVEEMRRPETLRAVAETLRRLHDGPSFPGRFDSFRVVEAYLATAATRGVAARASTSGPSRRRTRSSARAGAQPARPCHNDLLNANFIAHGETVGSSTGSTPAWATASSISPTSRSTTS